MSADEHWYVHPVACPVLEDLKFQSAQAAAEWARAYLASGEAGETYAGIWWCSRTDGPHWHFNVEIDDGWAVAEVTR